MLGLRQTLGSVCGTTSMIFARFSLAHPVKPNADMVRYLMRLASCDYRTVPRGLRVGVTR